MRPLLIVISSSLVLIAQGALSAPPTTDSSSAPARPGAEKLLLKDASATVVTTTTDKARDWREMRAVTVNEVRQLYRDFFTTREIEPTQADTLVGLLAEERVLTTSWSSNGTNHTPQAADHERAREVAAEIETMLGREGYAALKDYQETLRERLQLRKLVQLLDTVGHPLSSEQKERMVAIMVSERYRLNPGLYTAARGSPEQADEIVTLHDAYDDAVQALFQSVLTAEQREFAAKHFAKRAERRHIALARYRKALAEGDTSMGFLYPVD